MAVYRVSHLHSCYQHVKRGYYDINGKKDWYRSKWEANFARFLEFLKSNGAILDWEKEPQTFWFEKIKRGVRSYLPDFKITEKDGSHWWAEVKGYMDSKSKTKLKRFAKYYPKEKLIVFDSDWFKKNKHLKGIIKEWE